MAKRANTSVRVWTDEAPWSGYAEFRCIHSWAIVTLDFYGMKMILNTRTGTVSIRS